MHTSIFQKPLKIVLDRNNSLEFKENSKPLKTVIVGNINLLQNIKLKTEVLEQFKTVMNLLVEKTLNSTILIVLNIYCGMKTLILECNVVAASP